jgi:uncharacterized membrane protein YecN with MAPEG domain
LVCSHLEKSTVAVFSTHEIAFGDLEIESLLSMKRTKNNIYEKNNILKTAKNNNYTKYSLFKIQVAAFHLPNKIINLHAWNVNKQIIIYKRIWRKLDCCLTWFCLLLCARVTRYKRASPFDYRRWYFYIIFIELALHNVLHRR